jgi:osmotically inducible protein OsmC
MTVDVKYTTRASATGGRDGRAFSEDGTIDLKLVVPKELGGPGGDGVNPEKLFAAGYSACFLGALRFVAGQDKVAIPADATVSAEVGIGPRSDGGFGITANLTITAKGVDRATLEALVQKAHFVCPYSNATQNNLNVGLTVIA